MVIYFGKINLNSSHIFNVYRKELKLETVLNVLLGCFTDGTVYEKEIVKKTKHGLVKKVDTYTVSIQEKNDEYIRGYILKASIIDYKKYNINTKKLESKIVNADEAAEFYFDVYNEVFGYLTAKRLGHKNFVDAFEGLINECLKKDSNGYRFTARLYTLGMDIKEIEQELKTLSGIQELKFKIQPPNVETELLDDIEDNLNQYALANMSSKSIILTAASSTGLVVSSKLVQDPLSEINTIHSRINAKECTKKGYVEVSAVDKYGIKYTTANKKPYTKIIDNVMEFVAACQEAIFALRKAEDSPHDNEV